MAGNTSTSGVTVTSRALSLLGAFDQRHRLLSLTELAARAGLPLPTAHRLVGELVEWGALIRLADGRYAIGRRLWDLGLLAPVQTGLRQAASPFLHDVYAATLATVHLAVRDRQQVLYVERLSGPGVGPDRQHRRVATSVALHRCRQGAAGLRSRAGATAGTAVPAAAGDPAYRHRARGSSPSSCAGFAPRGMRRRSRR